MKNSHKTAEAGGLPPDTGEVLRRRAEERITSQRPKGGGQGRPEDTGRLVHELQVHQIELEMQNEELQQARTNEGALLVQYTDLYDFAPVGYLTLDREGKIHRANLTATRMLGVERSRLVSRRLGQFVGEGDRRAFSEFLEKVFASQVTESGEMTLPREGPRPLVVQIEGTRSADGQECRAVLVDVTERKRAEEEVRAVSRRQEALLAAVPDIIMEVDLRKVYTWANRAGLDFFGEDVVGKEAAFYFEGEQQTYHTVQPLFNGDKQLFFVESWQRRRDGQKRLLAWWCRALVDGHGTVTGALATARDITDRKKAEEAVRHASEEWQATFDAIVDGVIVLDQEQRIQRCNRAFADFVGLPAPEILGRKCHEVIHSGSTPIEGCPFHKTKRSGQRERTELVIGSRTFSALTDPLFGAGGSMAGAVHILTDITECKRAEERDRLVRDVLALLNREEAAENAIRDLLLMIKKNTGIEALGLRLNEGDDFPYWETNGFSEEFVHAERYLCKRDEAGKVVRDPLGKPVLECMCGNVLRGRTNPELPFFTEGGSFWSNSTTELLASSTEADRQAETRNRCNGEGYESVALIPLRSGDEIIGLLQLNDHRRDRFSLEQIRFFEGLGASIGIALSRKRAGEALRMTEERYRMLFETSSDGILITDAETKVFSNANPALCRMLGYTVEELAALNVTAIHPKEALPSVLAGFEATGRGEALSPAVVPFLRKDGKIVQAEINSTRIVLAGRTYNIALLRDITERKRAEEKMEQQLAELRRWHEVTLHREDRVAELKREVNELLVKAGQPPRYDSGKREAASGKR